MLNPYAILAAMAAFVMTGTGAYLKGRSDCSAKYEYAAVLQERNLLKGILKAEQDARAADAKRLTDNEALLRNLQERAEHDAQNLQDGGALCLAPADVDSLRQHFRAAR